MVTSQNATLKDMCGGTSDQQPCSIAEALGRIQVVQQHHWAPYFDCQFCLWKAIWCRRLQVFSSIVIHTKEWPPVERLPIHPSDEQMGVYDPARDSTNEVIQRIRAKDTKLLAFFKLKQTDPRVHNLLYSDIPNHYCWIPRVASQNIPAQWRQCAGNTTAVGRCTLFHQLQVNTFF